MRRTLLVAALVMGLGSWQLSAQHGGGHASGGGGHSGGFGGHSSGGGFSSHSGHAFSGSHAYGGAHYGAHSFSGARPFIPPRSYSGARSANLPPEAYNRGPAPGSFHSSSIGFSHANGINRSGVHVHIGSYPYFRTCFGYGCGWGFGWGWGWGYPYLWGGIDPYWWWDNDYSPYDSGDYPGPYSDDYADQMNGAPPWRPPDNADQQGYQPSTPREPASDQEASSEPIPATVLVFRDQHQQEVQNYAIIGQTLWAFAPQHTQKIPLADLDLPATTRANENRGVTFHLPAAAPAPTSTPEPSKTTTQSTT